MDARVVKKPRAIMRDIGESVDGRNTRTILKSVRRRAVGVEEALRQLRFLPYEDLGFAKVDHHRHLRRGFPEVIFGGGKTPAQIASIIGSLRKQKEPVLVTRASEAVYRRVRRSHPKAIYDPVARTIVLKPPRWRPVRNPGIVIIAAGTSDLPVAEEAAVIAEMMGNRVEKIYDVGVAGLHRLIAHRDVLLAARVVIVVAGMEGALPSVVASMVSVPVIGVPTSVGYGASFGGMAALLGMLNSCAGGLLVVNIDGGFSAGLSAALINRAIHEGSGTKARPE